MIRRIPWGAWYAAVLLGLIIYGCVSGAPAGLTPAEREACTEYVLSEYRAARDEGYTPADMPDCDP